MLNQTKNDNLNYLIDPTFDRVNVLFVHYHLKMKMIEYRMKSIIHQPLRLETIMW